MIRINLIPPDEKGEERDSMKKFLWALVKGTCVVVALAITAGVLYMYDVSDKAEQLKRSKIVNTDYGVVVSGYDSKGSIRNTGDFMVVIKCVIQGEKFENTEWIKRLAPGEAVSLKHVNKKHCFFISRDGSEVGFIKLKEKP